MGITKAQRAEHVELRVEDVDRTVEFFTTVIGLTEVARADGRVYLGCGLDENWDVAFSEGSPGLEHVAFRVDEGELSRLEHQLAAAGVATERRDGREPNQVRALRFTLPTGVAAEVVTVADNRYHMLARPAHPRRGIAPLDLDHIGISTTDVAGTAAFFLDHLGFRETEHTEPDSTTREWFTAFLRKGQLHHDVSVIRGTGTVHHVALALSNMEHIKVACDSLAAAGIRVEMGPSRHGVGGNLFAYARLPGGHRFELSAEMALLDDETPPKTWYDTSGVDAWGDVAQRVPPGFFEGS